MALFGKPLSVPAATAAVESAEARLAGYEAQRSEVLKAADSEPDFETGLALRDTVPALDRKIESAKTALRHAHEALEVATKAEAEAAIDAQAKAAERAALEAAKLVPVIDSKSRGIAADLIRLTELNAVVDAYNKIRGPRPFVVDGEARVREIPQKVHPAVYETVTVWRTPSGGRPTQFRVGRDGEYEPVEGGCTKHKEKVVSRAEHITPAQMPGGRFKDGFKLIGTKGERLFPR